MSGYLARRRCSTGARLWLAAALSIAGCTRGASEPARPIEIVVPTEAATLDPRFSTRSLDIKITRLVHAGLAGLDPDTLAPVPLVAERFDFEDDRTLLVTLKRGVRFHSGRPLSSADVCGTIDALNDKTLGSPHRAVVRAIGECEQHGPTMVRLRLREPRATLLSDLEVPILRADQARGAPSPEGRLDGLGPFRVEAVRFGEVTLAPADTGVLGKPRHRLVVRTVRDANARALRLMAGRSDIAPNAVSPTLLPALEGEAGLHTEARPGANVTYLLFQNDRAPFDRADVRRAVARAIDRETIVRTLLAGRGRVASWIFPAGHWAHAAKLRAEPFDPEAARPVLEPLPPVSLLTSTDRARVTVARAIAQMLRDAGLRVSVIPLDFGVMLQRMDAGDYLMATLQMPELTEPNILKWFFHPSGVPGEGGEGKNRARYRSTVAGELLDQASENRDIDVRQRLYTQLAWRMSRDMPVVPLWHEDQVALLSPRARGFTLSAEGRWLAAAALR